MAPKRLSAKKSVSKHWRQKFSAIKRRQQNVSALKHQRKNWRQTFWCQNGLVLSFLSKYTHCSRLRLPDSMVNNSNRKNTFRELFSLLAFRFVCLHSVVQPVFYQQIASTRSYSLYTTTFPAHLMRVASSSSHTNVAYASLLAHYNIPPNFTTV